MKIPYTLIDRKYTCSIKVSDIESFKLTDSILNNGVKICWINIYKVHDGGINSRLQLWIKWMLY